MNGIKNYLVKHGEGHLHDIIETERSKVFVCPIVCIDSVVPLP